MKQAELIDEIDEVIQMILDRGEVWDTNTVRHDVLMAHQGIKGPDTDLYRLCAFGHVGRTVNKVLAQYDDDPAELPDPQLTIPNLSDCGNLSGATRRRLPDHSAHQDDQTGTQGQGHRI